MVRTGPRHNFPPCPKQPPWPAASGGRIWAPCPAAWGFSTCFFAHQLCDFGQGRQPFWAWVSPLVKQGKTALPSPPAVLF